MKKSTRRALAKNSRKSKDAYYLWVTRGGKNVRLPTYDGRPLTERQADTNARKFDRSSRVVVRPASSKDVRESVAYVRSIKPNPRVRPFTERQSDIVYGAQLEAREYWNHEDRKKAYDRYGKLIAKRGRQGDHSKAATSARQDLRAKREGIRRSLKSNSSAAARVDALAQSYKKASPGRKKAIYKQWRAAVVKRDGLQSNPKVRPFTKRERVHAQGAYTHGREFPSSRLRHEIKETDRRLKEYAKKRGTGWQESRQELRARRLGLSNALVEKNPKRSTKRKIARKADKGRRDVARVEQIRARYGVYGR